MVSKAVLTAGNPEGDVMFGVDNTFLSRVVDADVFEPYEAAGLDQVPDELRALVPDGEATPVDFGDVCVNYDKAWFAEHDLDPPADLEALTDPAYADLLVVQNPATSSPGLAFVMATIAEFGEDGWQDYWTRLRDNGVEVVDGWTEAYYERFSGAGDGPKPLVVSYGTSPPVEVVFADPPIDAATTAVVDTTCFRQVEFAGVLRGTEHTDEARQLVDFLLSPTFQAELPLNLYVYPANADVPLPEVFTDNATLPADPATLDPATISRRPGDVDRRVDRHRPALSPTSDAMSALDRSSLVAGRNPPEPAPAGARGRAGGRAGRVPARVLRLAVRHAAGPRADGARRRRHARARRSRGTSPGSRCGRPPSARRLTIVVGLAPAYVLARYRFAGRRVLASLLTAAFVLPTVVMGAAVLALLPAGIERGVPAILLAHVIFNLAVVVRTVGAVWDHLPPDLEAAAATLGASPWRAFREITLPLLRPAILAAGSIVFVFTFTSFGVIRVLGDAGTSTIEVEIWRQATQLGDLGAAATLAVLQLVAVGAGDRLVDVAAATPRSGPRPASPGPPAHRPAPGASASSSSASPWPPPPSSSPRWWRSSSARCGAPTGTRSAAGAASGGPRCGPGIDLGIDPLAAIGVSLRTTVVATAIALGIGVLAALAITAAGRAGRLLDTGLMLPIATSAVTIGFGLLITFDVAPVDWRGSWWLVPVGQALVAVPFVVRAVLPVLRSVDPHLHEAAATLGASPTRAWVAITWPHLRRPLTAAAGLAAAISLGEFGATSFLSRSGSATMPIAIQRLLGRAGTLVQAQGYAMATILAAVTVALVLLVDVVGEDRRT